MYFGKVGNELLSDFFQLRSLLNRVEDRLFFLVKGFDLDFGVLKLGKVGTFYRFMSIIMSAIILRSYPSVVTLEMFRMVAPKGCRLMPSYLKFSINKNRAMILWRLVRS